MFIIITFALSDDEIFRCRFFIFCYWFPFCFVFNTFLTLSSNRDLLFILLGIHASSLKKCGTLRLKMCLIST